MNIATGLAALALISSFATAEPITSASSARQRAMRIPSETFVVGMMRVERFGTAGRTPIIFIPALFCGSSQWQREIDSLSPDHDIYALTLPGFDGRARDTGGALMKRASADISALIKSRHLDHPIVIGHSLGGTLAVLFATTHSDQVRGIIAVEGGYPFASTPEKRSESVKQAIAPYDGIPQSAFRDSVNLRMLQYVIRSKASADSMALAVERSDPAAVVDWLKEAGPLDLTTQLSLISVPLDEIVPYDSVIDPYSGFAKVQDKRAAYLEFLAHAPRGSLTMIERSRHFVMIDQPSAFDHALFAVIENDERGR